MTEKLLWLAPLVLGIMVLYAALIPPKGARTRWYVRLLIGIIGVWLVYNSTLQIFALKEK